MYDRCNRWVAWSRFKCQCFGGRELPVQEKINKYLDILTMMNGRTAKQVGAFRSDVNALYVYERPGADKEAPEKCWTLWSSKSILIP